jgi:hypothetical protein
VSVDPDREQLKRERDWLQGRVRALGSYSASEPETGGAAANAMVEYALGGKLPSESDYPHTEHELKACLNTLASAPAHLTAKMEEVLEGYRTSGLTAEPGLSAALPVSDFVAFLNARKFSVSQDLLPRGGYAADDTLLAEWQWLRERARLCGALFAADENVARQWGTSANALVDYLLGGPRPEPPSFPHDSGDLAACVAAVAVAPEHLKDKAAPVLAEYAQAVGVEPELSL